MKIACLHTAHSNVGVFADAAEGLPVTLRHEVRADLLAAAEAAGGLTPKIAEQTRAALRRLCEEADAVVLTCSTLGPAVDDLTDGPVPVLRTDAALAQAATARAGGAVVVLCAVATTLAPTAALFQAAASARVSPPSVTVALVDGAWDMFKQGRNADYLAAIAAAADAAYAEGADVVALGQASMAGAAALATRGQPLTSPRAALQSIHDHLAARVP